MDYKWLIGTVAIPIIILYFSKSRKFSSYEKHDAAKNILNVFQGFFQNVDTLKTHQSTNNKDQLLKFYKNSLKKHVDENFLVIENKKKSKIFVECSFIYMRGSFNICRNNLKTL